MTKPILYQIARRLRTLAKEIEETAIGSSRIEMYQAIAEAMREQASSLEGIAREVTS